MGNDILDGYSFANADRVDSDDDHDNNASCDDANSVCQQTHQTHRIIMQPLKDSEVCHSSPPHNQQLLSSSSSSIRHFYRQGMSAQAYKPNAPIKTNVCEFHPTNSKDESNPPHNVAHWSFWRSTYKDVVPIVVHANVYSCGSPSSPPPYSSSSDAINLEVWQPRPDGSFSSLHAGVEEGECRASVPIIITNTTMDNPNLVGQVHYETLAPGSTGVLGGLIPDSSRDYPPYGPGAIHMYLNMEGYHPSLVQLNMNELGDWMLQTDISGGRRFRFKGWDVRPHASKSTTIDGAGGMDIQSVKRIERPGYDLALEVEVDLFIVTENGKEEVGDVMEKSERDVFCSSHGYFNWISSFFKEPIAICFPSLLDFFAL